jgi:hypothetical protein
MQQKKRYRQLRKSKRSPLLEMQEQPFKRLFFLQKQTAARYRSKTANSAGQGQKPPAVQVQTKNRKQPRFRSEIGILSGKCAVRQHLVRIRGMNGNIKSPKGKNKPEKTDRRKTEENRKIIKSQVLWKRAERKK